MIQIAITQKELAYLKNNIINVIAVLLSAIFLITGEGINIGENRVIFMDVGQGDAALIQYGGYNIMVDTGPGDIVAYRLSKYLAPGKDKIDVVVLSHPHADHVSGLIELANRYEIGEVWLHPVCYKSALYQMILSNQMKKVSVVEGHELEIGSMSLSVLSPDAELAKKVGCGGSAGSLKSFNGNVNNDSVVLQLEANGIKVLFTGDMENELEKYLLGKKALAKAEVIKAGHHCSSTSSSSDLIKIVVPKVVICSSGEGNSYGHPNPQVVDRYKQSGAKVLITSESKDIIINL